MEEKISGLLKDKNGAYEWKYEMSLFRDLSIFWLVCKIFLLIIIGIWLVFFVILNAIEGTLKQNFMGGVQTMGIMAAIFLGLIIIGYLLYAAIMGGKYRVHFHMDDEKIVHTQAADQAKKAENIGLATAIAGILAKNPTTAGIGFMSTRTAMSTYYAEIKSVIAKRKKNTIILRGGGENRVYVSDEDFDFVKDFIRERVSPDVKWHEI